MNTRDIALIQASVARLLPMGDFAVRRFFVHLLAIDPSLQRCLPVLTPADGQRLMQRLGHLVHSLDTPSTSMAMLRELLNCSSSQPRSASRLGKLARAAMMTLHELLGPAFDTRSRSAWSALYFLALGVMADAAEQRPVAVQRPVAEQRAEAVPA